MEENIFNIANEQSHELLCVQEEPFFPIEEGFVFINSVPVEERIRGPLPPAKKEDCEVRVSRLATKQQICIRLY